MSSEQRIVAELYSGTNFKDYEIMIGEDLSVWATTNLTVRGCV